MNTSDIRWPGWENVELIGNGSFGSVYEIRRDHYGMEERAALKVISIPQSKGDIDELINDGYDVSSITARYESYLKDIVGEYSLMAQMKGHSNIVYCDDLNCIKHEDGIGWDIYIKMELLTALPKALPQDIPVDLVIKLGKDMCKALIACKKRNIVHRDIKPQNIFVAKDGTYKLGDFGIAKTAERTTSGTKIGTYKYMAPEVYKSEPYGSAADIYSLGLVMYWLLNERRTPFLPLPPQVPTASMEDEARTRRFKGEAMPSPAHGSPELQAIVLKACAYGPKDRFSSAEEMLEALNALTVPSIGVVKRSIAADKVAAAFISDQDKTETTVSIAKADKITPNESPEEMTEATVGVWQAPVSPVPKKKKKWWIPALIIALLIAVAAAAIYLKSDIGGSEVPAEETPIVEETSETEKTPVDEKVPVEESPSELIMATGGTSGTYYAFGGILGQQIVETTGMAVSVISSDGSKANILGIDSGDYQLGICQSDIAAYAAEGIRTFEAEGALDSFCAVGGLYAEAIQLVSTDPNIKSVSDLKGKTVSIGATGSAVYFNALDTLSAAGLTEDDINAQYQSFADSADSLKDGKIDAAFIVSGCPTPDVTELFFSCDAYLVPIEEKTLERLIAACPFYTPYLIPAGSYEGQTEDAATVAVKSTLIVSADASEEDVYALTAAIFDNADAIMEEHAKGAELSPKNAVSGIPVSLHPGSEKYFAEKGVVSSLEEVSPVPQKTEQELWEEAHPKRVDQADGMYYIYEYYPSGAVKSKYLYNADGSNFNSFEYEYDSAGRKTKETKHVSGVIAYTHEFDVFGNIKKDYLYTNGKPMEINEYEYNSSGQIITDRLYYGDGRFSQTVCYEYNSLGQRVKAINRTYNFTTVMEYDSAGQMRTATTYDENDVVTRITHYDENGNVTSTESFDF